MLGDIGYWSEVKLDIVREYASAYSRILSAQANPSLFHVYIDAFAGAGLHISRATGEFVLGSPLNALWIEPPFREYHFVDIDGRKVETLKAAVGEEPNVWVYHGDANSLLLEEVLPRAQYQDYRRALCLLDPCGLDLKWDVVCAAGQMRSVDLFLNFPLMDMNRNVLWANPDSVAPAQRTRMNGYWGDESWRAAAYHTRNLFGIEEKTTNEAVAAAFLDRLRRTAGFGYVPEPIPMRNSRGAIIYYLFFACQKPVAAKIVADIFNKYRGRGARDG